MRVINTKRTAIKSTKYTPHLPKIRPLCKSSKVLSTVSPVPRYCSRILAFNGSVILDAEDQFAFIKSYSPH